MHPIDNQTVTKAFSSIPQIRENRTLFPKNSHHTSMKTILTIIASLFVLSLPSVAQSEDIITIIPRDDSLAVQKNAGESDAPIQQYHARKSKANGLQTNAGEPLTATAQSPAQALEPSAKPLTLPALTDQGKMPSLSHPYGLGGWCHPMWGGFGMWHLHEGLNVSLGLSVFSTFGSGGTWSGAGFGQNVAMLYAKPLTDRLSIAAGGYLSNATWAHDTFREAGLTAVLGYQFDEHWSGYLYGQKSLRRNQPMPCLLQDIHDMGDKIGAAIRYSFSPSFSVQLNIEKRFLNDSGFYIPKSPTPLDRR